MQHILFGNSATTASTSAVNYLPIMGTSSSSPNSTESTRQGVAPASFTLSNLYVNLTAAPGTGKSYKYTLRQNGVDTALTITISDAATNGTDNTHSVSVAAGDILDFSITPTGTPTASAAEYNMVADSGGTHYAGLWGGAHTTTNLSTASTVYSQLTGQSNGGNSWNATELNQQIICPTGGTISNLYVSTDTLQGAAKSYAITLVQNGTPTALTTTLTNSLTGNDTTHSVTVAAGDTLSISATPTGTPTTGRYVWGLQFTPTNAGESFFGFGSANAPSASATAFEFPLGVGGNGYNSTETNRQLLMGDTTMTAFYVKLGTAPGAGNTRTITMRQNAASTAASVAISNANTTGNVTGLSVSVAHTDLIALQSAITGTPAADTNGVHTGVLLFISVPASSSAAPTHMMMGMGS